MWVSRHGLPLSAHHGDMAYACPKNKHMQKLNVPVLSREAKVQYDAILIPLEAVLSHQKGQMSL